MFVPPVFIVKQTVSKSSLESTKNRIPGLNHDLNNLRTRVNKMEEFLQASLLKIKTLVNKSNLIIAANQKEQLLRAQDTILAHEQ